MTNDFQDPEPQTWPKIISVGGVILVIIVFIIMVRSIV